MVLLGHAVSFVAGVFLADLLHASVLAATLLVVSAVSLSLLLTTARRSAMPGLLLLALAAGALRVALATPDDASELAKYHGVGDVALQGVVVSDPEAVGQATRFRLRTDTITAGAESAEASGDVLVTIRPTFELVALRDRPFVRHGDRLQLAGTVQAPPDLEEFDYAAFLARQGIGSVMSFPDPALVGEGEGLAFYRWLYDLRRRLAESVSVAIPEPQASLGKALLLGLRNDLPDDLVETFRRTGTSHLLAISGLHVSILLGLSLAASAAMFGRRGQRYLLAPLALIWLYVLIAGMSPSAARAAIMGSVYLLALAVGRPRSVLPALGLAAALMVALNPDVLWRVSFQLSFAAMAGIAVLADPISSNLRSAVTRKTTNESNGERFLIALPIDATAMTVAATLATLPLAALYFERVSLVGIPATALTLPVLPAVLVSQGAAAAVGLVSEALATPLGWVAWAPTAYMTGVVGLLARLPAAAIETGPVAPLLVWAYYIPFAIVYLAPDRWLGTVGRLASTLSRLRAPVRTETSYGGWLSWWLMAPAASLALLALAAATSLPSRELHVVFADVGQGDTALITTPGGARILVDGGPDPLGASRLLGSNMNPWERSIDLVVLTHPHADHATGLVDVLHRYRVDRVLEHRIEYSSPDYAAWDEAVREEDAQVIAARAGQVFAFNDGVVLEVLGPPERLLAGTASDIDNASVVLRVMYGNVSFLLASDIFAEAEVALTTANAPLDSDILKVPHHGSRSSSSRVFLDRVSPIAAVISAGADNRHGHPHPETMEALREHVSEDAIFLTSQHGNVEFVTDGERLRVVTER